MKDWISRGGRYLLPDQHTFNCWDLLFYFEYKDNLENGRGVNWCDVEQVIHDTLTSKPSNKTFSWEQIFKVFSRDNYQMQQDIIYKPSETDNKNRMMVNFLKEHFGSEEPIGKSCFYDMLLKDLQDFERTFGRYISDISEKDDYKNKARDCVDRLGFTDGSKIDSFNYSDFSNATISIRHINGDCNNPIFGIDLSKEDEENFPNAIRFTKTARRIQQDSYKMNRDTEWSTINVDRAVVFGHSLNRMDYDYFNYLFTVLKFNTFDIREMGSIEFVYNIYDYNLQDEIRTSYANCVYDLLNYYEEYISNSNQHVLINLLRFSGKLRIKEYHDI